VNVVWFQTSTDVRPAAARAHPECGGGTGQLAFSGSTEGRSPDGARNRRRQLQLVHTQTIPECFKTRERSCQLEKSTGSWTFITRVTRIN